MNGNMINYEIIGKRMRDSREAMGLTQGKMAIGIGVCASFIGQLERGEKKPSLETIARICAALDVTTDYLLFGRRYPCDREHCDLVREIDMLIHGDRMGGCR